MRFTRNGDVLRAIHVSGPTHNLLGLSFASSPTVISVDSLPGDGPANLSSEPVRLAVETGVRQAAEELQLQIYVRAIQFVASDSGPATRYEALAYAIVHHFAEQLCGVEHSASATAKMRRGAPADARMRSHTV